MLRENNITWLVWVEISCKNERYKTRVALCEVNFVKVAPRGKKTLETLTHRAQHHLHPPTDGEQFLLTFWRSTGSVSHKHLHSHIKVNSHTYWYERIQSHTSFFHHCL